MPREAAVGASAWPAWTWSAYDAFRLGEEARAAFAAISPEVRSSVFGKYQNYHK